MPHTTLNLYNRPNYWSDTNQIGMDKAQGEGVVVGMVHANVGQKRLNRLTAMVAYLRPLFFELRTSLKSFRIFVRCQRLIARNVADGSIDPTPNEGRMAPPWW